MHAFDKNVVLGDGFRWTEDVKKVQGHIISDFIVQILKPENNEIEQFASKRVLMEK